MTKTILKDSDFFLLKIVDEYPDLSWLRTEYDESYNGKTAVIKDSCRYTNEDIKEYGWDTVKKWIDEDHKRLKTHGKTWDMLGVGAAIEFYYKGEIAREEYIPCWGIESDSGDDYFVEFYDEAIIELKERIKENYKVKFI